MSYILVIVFTVAMQSPLGGRTTDTQIIENIQSQSACIRLRNEIKQREKNVKSANCYPKNRK